MRSHLGFWPPCGFSCWGPDQKLNVWLLPTTVPNDMLSPIVILTIALRQFFNV